MAKTSSMNIRIEPNLKKQVEEILEDLGMNISDAVTIYFKQIVLRCPHNSNEMRKDKKGKINIKR